MIYRGLKIIGWTILLVGCGMMGNPKEESSKDITLPQKSSISVPKALRNSSKTKPTDKSKDLNLDWVNEYVVSIDDIVQEQKFFMILTQQIMPQINKLCSDKEMCILASKELSLEVNSGLVDDLEEINMEIDSRMIGHSISFGAITFEQNRGYRLTADISTIYSELLGMMDVDQVESIAWSRDNKKVVSSYLSVESDYNSSVTLSYLEHSNGQNDMNISELFNDRTTSENYNFSFALSELNDANKTEKIYSQILSHELDEDSSFEDVVYTTDGEIYSGGGYLYNSIELESFTYMEKLLFDKDGEIDSAISCFSDEECDITDESTWYETEIIFEDDVEGE